MRKNKIPKILPNYMISLGLFFLIFCHFRTGTHHVVFNDFKGLETYFPATFQPLWHVGIWAQMEACLGSVDTFRDSEMAITAIYGHKSEHMKHLKQSPPRPLSLLHIRNSGRQSKMAYEVGALTSKKQSC